MWDRIRKTGGWDTWQVGSDDVGGGVVVVVVMVDPTVCHHDPLQLVAAWHRPSVHKYGNTCIAFVVVVRSCLSGSALR